MDMIFGDPTSNQEQAIKDKRNEKKVKMQLRKKKLFKVFKSDKIIILINRMK